MGYLYSPRPLPGAENGRRPKRRSRMFRRLQEDWHGFWGVGEEGEREREGDSERVRVREGESEGESERKAESLSIYPAAASRSEERGTWKPKTEASQDHPPPSVHCTRRWTGILRSTQRNATERNATQRNATQHIAQCRRWTHARDTEDNGRGWRCAFLPPPPPPPIGGAGGTGR